MHQNETDRHYLKRVNRITKNSMMETEFEKKYGVDVIRNEKNAVITIKKRPKDQLVELMKGKIGKKNNDKNPKEIHLSEIEKKILVKEMLEKKKNEKLQKSKDDIVEFKKDEFIFGEVVHAPPQLSVPRKAKKAETVSRPGGKKSLLLHSILANTQSQQKHNKIVENQTTSDIVKKKNKVQSNKIDFKGKRKNLPTLARQMIEIQQQDVMEMYKTLKKNKRLCTD